MSFSMRWETNVFLIIVFVSSCSAEWALVNIIRHGERYDEKTHGGHLHPLGEERAQYIAKCVMDPNLTLAFPLGRPTQLLVSYGHDSTRPLETLMPLSEKAGIPIDQNISYDDIDAFVAYVHKLKHAQTLFVAWQHKKIPSLTKAWLGDMAPAKWPAECPYAEWIEPDEIQNGACYDAIWQMALYRHNHSQKWEAQAFSQMHQGFAGHQNSACAQAFRPNSNPTHWNQRYKNQSGALQLSSMQLVLTEISDSSQAYVWLFGFASASIFWALLWAAKSISTLAHRNDHREPLLRERDT